MKYKEYSPEILSQITNTLDEVLEQDPSPIAAFDADGTLWDIDLGETFFNYKIDKKLVPLPPNAFEHYENLKKENIEKAYLWLAQICQGHCIEKIRNWARHSVELQAPLPVFLPQKKLIDLFLEKGVKVYIVTASVKWAVEPGAEILGLHKDNVIGIETEIVDGNVTDTQKGLITYRQGKLEALLEKTNGKYPFFASGNTIGDSELLKGATHLRLAVSAASRDEKLFRTEEQLRQIAEENSWLYHRFI